VLKPGSRAPGYHAIYVPPAPAPANQPLLLGRTVVLEPPGGGGGRGRGANRSTAGGVGGRWNETLVIGGPRNGTLAGVPAVFSNADRANARNAVKRAVTIPPLNFGAKPTKLGTAWMPSKRAVVATGLGVTGAVGVVGAAALAADARARRFRGVTIHLNESRSPAKSPPRSAPGVSDEKLARLMTRTWTYMLRQGSITCDGIRKNVAARDHRDPRSGYYGALQAFYNVCDTRFRYRTRS
jgi:hypothetical protein